MVKVYFQTHGCSANLAESEMMMGIAESEGNIVSDKESADVMVINICTVKGDANALRHIRMLRQSHPEKKLIVAGCIPKYTIPKIKALSPNINLINTYNIKKINEVIEKSLNNQFMDAVQYSDELKIELPRIRANSVIGIVPISSGCISQCTFCSVKQIKGNLKSYPLLSIIHDINIAINNGCKEIWLTSQDNGCYGFDINTNLARLLEHIIKIDGEFMIRIGMASPQHLINYLDELIQVLKSEKIFKFIHLPVQSGNEQILKKMRREYDVSIFKAVIKNIRDAIPNLTLSTDVICGFPTETEEQFDDTLRLIEEITPDIVNISRYQARPYTPSAKMPQLSGEELKNRTRKLTKLFNVVALQQNRKWIDWQGRIIIDEVGKNNTFIGRNYAYKPVVVSGEFKLGERVNVKINDVTSYDLRGEIVNG